MPTKEASISHEMFKCLDFGHFAAAYTCQHARLKRHTKRVEEGHLLKEFNGNPRCVSYKGKERVDSHHVADGGREQETKS